MLILDLPWPPSANSYIRHSGNRRYFSPAGVSFLGEVGQRIGYLKKTACRTFWQAPEGFLTIGIALYPPNKRKIDTDNRIKPTLDALVKCGVIEDDYLVQKVIAERRSITKDGLCRVYISGYIENNDDQIN